MFEKNVFKCELLEFALAYRYKSFEKLKQSIVVELGDEKYDGHKVNKIQDIDTSIMSKTIWIIVNKFVEKIRVGTRPKTMKKLKNSVIQEINNYRNTKGCKQVFKDVLLNDPDFDRKVVNVLKHIKVITFGYDNSIIFDDQIISGFEFSSHFDLYKDVLEKYSNIS